jgi:hypothetical protein
VSGAIGNAWKLTENYNKLYILDKNIDKEVSNCLITGAFCIFFDDVRYLGDVSGIVIRYFQSLQLLWTTMVANWDGLSHYIPMDSTPWRPSAES